MTYPDGKRAPDALIGVPAVDCGQGEYGSSIVVSAA